MNKEGQFFISRGFLQNAEQPPNTQWLWSLVIMVKKLSESSFKNVSSYNDPKWNLILSVSWP